MRALARCRCTSLRSIGRVAGYAAPRDWPEPPEDLSAAPTRTAGGGKAVHNQAATK